MTEPAEDERTAVSSAEPAADHPPALSPTEPAADGRAALSSPQSFEELFGGRRGIVDGAVPTIVFVLVNAVRHDVRIAGATAVGSAIVFLAIRLARKERTRHVMSGVLGVAISAAIAARSGRASDYFKPGIWLNAGYLAAFVASVLVGRPIVGLVLKQFSDKPPAWHRHRKVRRAYSELTLMWAAMYGLRVGVIEPLRRRDANALAAAMKIALGYPPRLLMLAITMPYLRWRTRGVPVEQTSPAAEAQ